MNSRTKSRLAIVVLTACVLASAAAQGTFQNLDFENGTFIPIPGDPFGRVEFSSAMPGWTGYVGTNQVNWILYNNLFLSTAGIAIWGPDQPQPGLFHGQYYVVLQGGNDPSGGPGRVGAAIAQTGTIPETAQSIRFYLAAGGLSVLFAGQPIPLSVIGSSPTGYNIYAGDISAFAGQTGELRFQGGGYLDFIQFSDLPIPEPSALSLLGLGALLYGWRFQRKQNDES
jgi:hypothetical protein